MIENEQEVIEYLTPDKIFPTANFLIFSTVPPKTKPCFKVSSLTSTPNFSFK